ncbi:MAG: hypothetical protein ABL914_07685 [Novosphingobium sp.]
MANSNFSRRFLFKSAGAVSLLAVGGSDLFGAKPKVPEAPVPDFLVTEGNIASLAGVKRVIISNFVCAFQMDGSVHNDNATRLGSTTFFGGKTKEVEAKMAWPNPDTAVLQAIADAGLSALKADFRAKGIEVLDEALLASQPTYPDIIVASGLTQYGDYMVGNISDNTTKGDTNGGMAKIVSATGLKAYNHSLFEGGQCCYVHGKGYPSSKIYYVPGHETAIAKALDCVVVKVWQFINFTKVSAKSESERASTNYSASAQSVVRLREEKSRIAFRLPVSANIKKSAKAMPPKDGDVVVALGNPVFIGTDYYTIFDAGDRMSLAGTQHLNFGVTLNDAAGYKKDVGNAISAALSGLVRTALGR